MRARLIGYWKVTLSDSYALPQLCEGPLDPAVRARLVAYLDAGRRVNQYRGFSHCRYGFGDNGSAERADGEWLWPEGLSHYVAVHGVVLPEEFIAHVLAGRASDGLEGAGSRVDATEEDWIRWSGEKMPPAFKAMVRDAIARADQQAEMAIEAEGKKLEQQQGLSDTMCMQAGCERRACRDRALCGRCLVIGSGTIEWIRSRYEMEELRVVLRLGPSAAKASEVTSIAFQ